MGHEPHLSLPEKDNGRKEEDGDSLAGGLRESAAHETARQAFDKRDINTHAKLLGQCI